MTNKFGFSPVIQDHTVLLEHDTSMPSASGSTPDSITKTRQNDYTSTKMEITATNAVSLKPFVYSQMFSGTGITWNTDVKILRNKFLADKYDPLKDEPEWEYTPAEWDEDSFTTHTLNAVLAFSDTPITSSLSLTANLPPRLDAYSGTFTAAFSPYVTLNASAGIRELDGKITYTAGNNPDKIISGWIFDPFRESLSLRLFNSKLSLTQSYAYAIEEKDHSELRFGISGYGANLTYTSQRTQGYDWIGTNWEPRKKSDGSSLQEFLPVSLAASYSSPGIQIYAWKNRMKLNLGGATTLSYDMLRPTSSYFTFAPKLIFDVNQFLHIGFSVQSRNSRIFWYFQALDDHNINNGEPPPGVETNLFVDLFNSFAFWDESLRAKSGFKLESLTVDVVHELHDWFLAAALTMVPQTTGTNRNIKTEFSLSVLWRPMQSIKSTIKTTDDGVTKTFKLNPDEASTTTN
jgi:hypothetical protein